MGMNSPLTLREEQIEDVWVQDSEENIWIEGKCMEKIKKKTKEKYQSFTLHQILFL
jgi:hypothetical protein